MERWVFVFVCKINIDFVNFIFKHFTFRDSTKHRSGRVIVSDEMFFDVYIWLFSYHFKASMLPRRCHNRPFLLKRKRKLNANRLNIFSQSDCSAPTIYFCLKKVVRLKKIGRKSILLSRMEAKKVFLLAIISIIEISLTNLMLWLILVPTSLKGIEKVTEHIRTTVYNPLDMVHSSLKLPIEKPKKSNLLFVSNNVETSGPRIDIQLWHDWEKHILLKYHIICIVLRKRNPVVAVQRFVTYVPYCFLY